MTSRIGRNLQFRHVAMFTDNMGILASARRENAGEICIFLIIGAQEKAYQKDIRNDSWQLLDREDFLFILQSICGAVKDGMAIHKINGNAERLINNNS
jgi:hypothetical protein